MHQPHQQRENETPDEAQDSETKDAHNRIQEQEQEEEHNNDNGIWDEADESASRDVVKHMGDLIQSGQTRGISKFITDMPDEILRRIFPNYDPDQDVGKRNEQSLDDDDENSNDSNMSNIDNLLPLDTVEKLGDLMPCACKKGDASTVKLLLFYGVDAGVKGKEGSPLEVATYQHHKNIIDDVLEYKPALARDISEVKSCLASACKGGHTDLIQFWLKHLDNIYGRRPSSVDFDEENDPVISACLGNHPELAKKLFEEGLFFVTSDTVAMGGENLSHCLEVWVDEEKHGPVNTATKRLRANWSKKNIHTFDPAWIQLPCYTDALIAIDLSHNSLKMVPVLLLWGLPWLENLNLSHTELTKLPSPGKTQQVEQSCLKCLIIANNKFREVPEELFMLEKLETLSLAHNRIKTIQLKNLGIIAELQDTDERVWRCRNLTHLDLSYNQLDTISLDISVATQLTMLNLSHNNLSVMPTAWDCPMTKLNMSHNQIRSLPSDIHTHWKSSLSIVDLATNQLTEFPITICHLTSLVELSLSGNSIDNMPRPEQWVTPKLRVLNLSHNRLFHSNTDYSNTNEGNRSPSPNKKDRISVFFPKHFKKRPRRQPTPSDTDTRPKFYAPLDDLSADKLTVKLPSIFNKSLFSINLSHNKLQDFPETICNMRSLKILELQGNPDMNSLPEQLSTITDLFSIKIDPGQITDPPGVEQALKEGARSTLAIRHVLREKLRKSKPHRGLKLMIVGPMKGGKTTVMTRLAGCAWPAVDRSVNIREWTLTNPLESQGVKAKERIDFNIWDLKNGENYELVHQTLFTPRTLYLLVWDIRERDKVIEDLKPLVFNIKFKAPQSSIVTVGTHRDLLSESHDRQAIIQDITQEIRTAYPQIAQCVIMEANKTDGLGMVDLKRAIYDTASKMKYRHEYPLKEEGLLVGRKVPESYIVMEALLSIELKKLERNGMPIPRTMKEEELSHMFKRIPYNHIETTEEENAMVRFLRDSGSLIHVSDHTFQLTNIYFLDPAWLCDVLLAVVQFKHKNTSNAQDGMVLKDELLELCTKSGFGESRFEEYLQLLGRFEIALAAGQNRYLIPSLLGKCRPLVEQTSIQHQVKVQRWYKMAYIPPGFWSRLVSRLMVNIRQKGLTQNLPGSNRLSVDMQHINSLVITTTVVCQEAITVNHETGQILVEPLSFPDGKMGIRVDISSRTEEIKTLGFVVDHIENLIKEWYPDLDASDDLVEKFVPCPVCERKMSSAETALPRNIFTDCHIFPFKELAVAATIKGLEHVTCERHPDELVSLKAMVSDLFLLDLGVAHLDESQLTVGHKLGTGSFGEVYKAKYKGKAVALKKLFTGRSERVVSDGAEITEDVVMTVISTFPKLRSELAIMSQLHNHPCILKLIGVSIHRLCFAMEFAPLGDLATFIHEQYVSNGLVAATGQSLHEPVLPRLLTYKISLQITAAIAYLHKRRVIHTDLKTDNILLFSADTEDPVNVKLADYGISNNLVADGVRTRAGFHAFCAPEIVHGKAFDEKVDIFSLGMVFYHLMSGTIPFGEDQSIETKINVAKGQRPELKSGETPLLSHFTHLESLMQNCWEGSPNKRPSAKDALSVMQDASFLCLRNSIEVECAENACLCAQDRYGIKEDDETLTLQLWSKEDQRRNLTTINFKNDDILEDEREYPGKEVLCAIQFGNNYILGTRSEKLQVYKLNQQKQKLEHRTDLKVPAQVYVTSMHYHPYVGKSFSEVQGYLYVGLEDSNLLVYSHGRHSNTTVHSGSATWKRKKVMLLSAKPKPCTSMLMIDHRRELLVGCGNSVRILHVPEQYLDPVELEVTQSVDRQIEGMAYYGDMVWCFVNNSDYVMQYDISICEPFARLCCSAVLLTSNIVDKTSKDIENAHQPSGTRPVSMEEGHVFSAAGKPSDHPGNVRRTSSVGDPAETNNVTSLLVVKDTLWIGRSNGDILVVGIDTARSNNFKFGDVLAILQSNSMVKLSTGPVTKIFNGVSGRVVACRKIKPKVPEMIQHGILSTESSAGTARPRTHSLRATPSKYQVLVWEAWGSQDVTRFTRACTIQNLIHNHKTLAF